MDKSCLITLVSRDFTIDEIGRQIGTETLTNVYAQVSSVYGAEWHKAGQNGIKPQFQFTVFEYDYHGEEILIYEGVEYGIYRTYMTKNEKMELYVAKKVGRDGKDD